MIIDDDHRPDNYDGMTGEYGHMHNNYSGMEG